MNTDYSIEGEIKERIAAGSGACYAHKTLFTSNIISRIVKMQLYNNVIRPRVTYASENLVLKENVINKLMTFGRNIMREIYGPSRTDDGYWGIETNQISDILKGKKCNWVY